MVCPSILFSDDTISTDVYYSISLLRRCPIKKSKKPCLNMRAHGQKCDEDQGNYQQDVCISNIHSLERMTKEKSIQISYRLCFSLMHIEIIDGLSH